MSREMGFSHGNGTRLNLKKQQSWNFFVFLELQHPEVWWDCPRWNCGSFSPSLHPPPKKTSQGGTLEISTSQPWLPRCSWTTSPRNPGQHIWGVKSAGSWSAGTSGDPRLGSPAVESIMGRETTIPLMLCGTTELIPTQMVSLPWTQK